MSDAVRLGFTEAMYNAACDGRKTQTRRVIVPPPLADPWWSGSELHEGCPCRSRRPCPYGVAGTRLGLTEPFKVVAIGGGEWPLARIVQYKWRHEPDQWGSNLRTLWPPASHLDKPAARPRDKYLSGRFMPLWAVRRWAVVEGVRAEHLQEITWPDIRAEGIECPEHDGNGCFCCSECPALRAAWVAKWDSINGARYPWVANPFVWAITFRMEEQADE